MFQISMLVLLDVIKFSRADSCVSMCRFSDIAGTNFVPISRVCDGLVATKLIILVLPNHQHTLKFGTELVAETLGNLRILRRLSAQEN